MTEPITHMSMLQPGNTYDCYLPSEQARFVASVDKQGRIEVLAPASWCRQNRIFGHSFPPDTHFKLMQFERSYFSPTDPWQLETVRQVSKVSLRSSQSTNDKGLQVVAWIEIDSETVWGEIWDVENKGVAAL